MKNKFSKFISATLVAIMLLSLMPIFTLPANAANPDIGMGFLLRGFNVLSGNELRNRNLATAPIFNSNAATELAPLYDFYPFTESITNVNSGKSIYELGISAKLDLSAEAGVDVGIGKLFKVSAKAKYGVASNVDFKNALDSYFYEFSLAHSVGKNTFNNINSPTTINAIKSMTDAEFLSLLTDSSVSPAYLFNLYGTHFITSYEMGGYAEVNMAIANNQQKFPDDGAILKILREDGFGVNDIPAAAALYGSLASYQENSGYSKSFSGRVIGGSGGLDYSGDPNQLNSVYNSWVKTFNPNAGSGFNCEILTDVRYDGNGRPVTSLSMMGIWELLPNGYTERYNELVHAYLELSSAQDVTFFNDFVYKTVQPIGNMPRPDVDGAILISTPEQLNNVRNNLSGKYILTNDITLTENWVPINGFSGILEGNGYTVKGVTINGAEKNLFGTSPGTFRNLVVSYIDRASFFSLSNGITINTAATVVNCYTELAFNEATADRYTYNNGNIGSLVNNIVAKQAIVDLSAITDGKLVGDKKIIIDTGVDVVWFKGSVNVAPYLYVNFDVKGDTIIILENCYIDTASSIKFSGVNSNPAIVSIGRSNEIVGHSLSGSNAIIEAVGNLAILGSSDILIFSSIANGQDAIRVAGTLDIALDGVKFEARGGNGANGNLGTTGTNVIAIGGAGGTGGRGGDGGTGGNGVIANRLNVLSNSRVYLYGGLGGNGGTGGTGGRGGPGSAGTNNYVTGGVDNNAAINRAGGPGGVGGLGGTGGRGGDGGNGGDPLSYASFSKSESSSLYLMAGKAGAGGPGGVGGLGGTGGRGGTGGGAAAGGSSGNGGNGGRGGTGGVGGTGGNGGHNGNLAIVGGISQNYGGAGGAGGRAGSGGSGGSGGSPGAYGPGSGCGCFLGIHSCWSGSYGYSGSTGLTGSVGSSGTDLSGTASLSYLDPISSEQLLPLTGTRLIIQSVGNIMYAPGQVFDTSGLALGLKQAGTLHSPISPINIDKVDFIYDFSKLGTTLVTVCYNDNNGEYTAYIPVIVVERDSIFKPKINVSSALGRAGEEVTLTVSLENNPGIASYAMTLRYPDTLTYVSAGQGDILISNFYADTTTTGQVTVTATSPLGTDISTGSILFTLTFKINEGVGDCVIDESSGLSLGYYTVGLDGIEHSEQLYQYRVDPQPTVIVRNTVYGDVNGDGGINMLDVTRLLRYIRNVDTSSTNFVAVNADVNGDGLINMLDVTRLLRYIQNIDPSPLGPKMTPLGVQGVMFAAANGLVEPVVSVSDASGVAGDTVTLTVSLENNPGIASYYLTMRYPDALTFVSADMGDILSTNFYADISKAGQVAVSATSPLGTDISTGSVLFTLTFKINDDAPVGVVDGLSLDYFNAMLDGIEHNAKLEHYSINQGTVTVIPVVFDVTFVVDGEVYAVVPVESGETVERPEDPVKSGYVFLGWFLNDEEFNFDTPITESAVLVAKWKASEATVISATPSALVKQLNGNKNDLMITIVETLSDGTTNTIAKTFSINNNAADTYTIGSYRVYVDTKGNTQIRACYIV